MAASRVVGAGAWAGGHPSRWSWGICAFCLHLHTQEGVPLHLQRDTPLLPSPLPLPHLTAGNLSFLEKHDKVTAASFRILPVVVGGRAEQQGGCLCTGRIEAPPSIPVGPLANFLLLPKTDGLLTSFYIFNEINI